MIIFPDPAGAGLRADYFDSGGHTIHYQVVPGADAHVARFVSTAQPSVPRFRLTYTLAADNRTMHITFELAPPGSDAFSTTIAEGIDTRVSGP
jgi:hypothetical protein